jgi:hypothetical protein
MAIAELHNKVDRLTQPVASLNHVEAQDHAGMRLRDPTGADGRRECSLRRDNPGPEPVEGR